MKICLVNGSPKRESSASAIVVEALRAKLGEECAVCETASATPEELTQAVSGCEAVAVVFPLYVDGIPAHLLRLLCAAETAMPQGAALYVVVQNGFYEAHQNQTALDMMKSFGERAGLRWGQGLCLGGGPLLHAAPVGRGPNQKAGLALDALAANMRAGQAAEDLFVKPGFPRGLYIFGGHMGWKSSAKQNGVSKRALWGKE